MFLASLSPAAAAGGGGFLQWFGTGCAPYYGGSSLRPVPKIDAKGSTLAPGDADFAVCLSDQSGMPLLLIGLTSSVSGNPALP